MSDNQERRRSSDAEIRMLVDAVREGNEERRANRDEDRAFQTEVRKAIHPIPLMQQDIHDLKQWRDNVASPAIVSVNRAKVVAGTLAVTNVGLLGTIAAKWNEIMSIINAGHGR